MTESLPVLAMILSGIGNILMSLGAIIQKQGADKAPEIGKNPIKETIQGFITNKTWLIGALLGITGVPILWLALQYGGLIYTQPMIGLGNLVIVIYALKILKEKINKTETIGIFLIIMSPTIIAYGSQIATSVKSDINSTVIIALYIVLYLVITLLIFFSKKLEKGKKKAVIFAFITGILIGLGALSGRLSALYTGYITIVFIFLLLVNLGLGTIFAQIMYQQGRGVITITIANFFNITLPIIAGVLILSEKINPALATGIIAIIIGCALVSKIQSRAISS